MWPTTEKGTPGETRKKNRQAFQEWMRERSAFDSFQRRYEPRNHVMYQRNIVIYDQKKKSITFKKNKKKTIVIDLLSIQIDKYERGPKKTIFQHFRFGTQI